MKGNKKVLAVALLLLLVAVSFGTYAIYKSSGSADATADVAAWVVKVNGTNIVTTDTYTFTASDIVWDANTKVASGKIAPGSTGKLKLAIDATEAEVAVKYKVEVGTIKAGTETLSNDKISVTAPADGTIALGSTAATNVEIPITWTAEDETETNTKDMALAGKTITIPVTVTVTQDY